MTIPSQSIRANSRLRHVRIFLTQTAVLSALVLTACSSSNTPSDAAPDTDNTGTPDNQPTPGTAATQARYRLTFDAIWSAETHPQNFPGNPHFSGLVGAVHNEQVRFWESAQIASAGIQRMAETGSKATLLAEVDTAINAGSALSSINGGGVGSSPGSTSVEFVVTQDYPEITITSMLAPSPDWFIGLHNYSLFYNGEFLESATIDLILYDSGSDNGLQYTSANDATDPLSPISRVSSDAQDSPFIEGEPDVGSFTIMRLPD